MLEAGFLVRVGVLISVAWIPMGYALATDILKPEYFVAVTLGAVMLIFFLLKHEAGRILEIVDRIPTREWFAELVTTLREIQTTLQHHESRIAYLEGRDDRGKVGRRED